MRRLSAQNPNPSSLKDSPDQEVNHSLSNSPFRSASVEVEIEAFEERYAAAAAQTVQDLIMLNFAPRVQRGSIRPPSASSDRSNLGFGGSLRKVSVNWKPSRFTLIRGPHIDKIGMEQFEIRRFKRSVRGATDDASELEWFLEHLKSVDFTGVEMRVHITSSLDLDLAPSPASKTLSSSSPAPSSPASSSTSPSFFSQHISTIPSKYLEPAKAMLAIENEARQKDKDIKASLSKLRRAVSDGLEARLDTLTSSSWFRQWRVDSGMGQPLPPLPDSQDHPIKDEARKKAAAFLVALDKVLLAVPLGELQDTKPSLESIVEQIRFITFVPGAGTFPASQWIHAAMKVGQVREKMRELASDKKDLESLYSSYVVFTQALIASLIRQWSMAVIEGEKLRQGLPSQEKETELRGASSSSQDDSSNSKRPRTNLFK